jgi:hypothetical protein
MNPDIEAANPPAWAAKTMTAADLAYFCLNHVTFSEAYDVVEFIAGSLAGDSGSVRQRRASS